MDQISHNVYYIGPATTYEEAMERLYHARGPIAVDTETIGLKGDKSVIYDEYDEEGELATYKTKMNALTCIGFGIAISTSEAFYFPLGRPGWRNVPQCDTYPGFRKLEDDTITKVFFNSMFDLERLDETFELDIRNFHDVAIGCNVQGLWAALDRNVGELLGWDHTSIDEVLPKGKTMLDIPFPVTARKCMYDCMDTLHLFHQQGIENWSTMAPFVWEDHLQRKFDVTKKIAECYEVDRQMVPLLRRMSKRGIKVNQEKVLKWQKKLDSELRAYDTALERISIDTIGVPINPGSNDQVGTLLTNRGSYIPLTDSKRHYKVNEEVIHRLKDPVGYMVLSRRHRQKLKGTYIDKAVGKDRIYTHFRLDLATGRLASFDINMQNQPDILREIYESDRGFFSWADLEQAELRVWANQAKDTVMQEAFARGESPHVTTLNALFPGKSKKNPDGSATREYTDSKGFNFALLADATPEVMAKATKRPVWECARLKNELYTLYWRSKVHQDYMRVRHTSYFYPDYVESDFGRRCHIPDGVDTPVTHQEKCRLNYPFQATIADYIKRMSLGLQYMDLPIQVHDEQVQDGTVWFPGMDKPASEKPYTVEQGWMTELHPSIRMPYEVKGGKTWI